jgi:hypothetical protein
MGNGESAACLGLWTMMKLSELRDHFDEGIWFGMINNPG